MAANNPGHGKRSTRNQGQYKYRTRTRNGVEYAASVYAPDALPDSVKVLLKQMYPKSMYTRNQR